MRIIGRPAPTPMPRSDLRQEDPRHASYVFGKEEFLEHGVNEALAKAKDSGEFDGDPGAPGVTPHIGSNGNWYIGSADTGVKVQGKDGTSVTVKSVSESSADGGSNVVIFSDGKTVTIKNGSKGSTGGKGDTGATGQRGTGLLPVTTAPSSYTTAVGGITPKYRMAISTIKTQAGVTEVLLGDTVRYSYYHYPIDYLDASYAYFENRVSIRGATGAAGKNGADGYTPVKGTDYWTEADKAEIVEECAAAVSVPKVVQTTGESKTAVMSQKAVTDALKGISLGIASDGLIYIFVDGQPVGTGIPQSTGESGDVFGYVDENNTIVLNGALADGTYNIKYEMDDGSTIDIGDLVLDSNVYYSVANTLTNCTSNNSTKSIAEGESYSATISAKDGYKLSSVKVTMGGTDISSTAVSGGTISIASVTGDIVITAVAEEIVINYTNLFVPSKATINKRLNSSKAVVDLNGYVITNFMDVSDKTPFTSTTKIYIKGATFTSDSNTKVQSFKNATTTDYTTAYSTMNGSAVTVTDEGNGVISVSGSNIASTFATDIKQMVLVLKVSDSAITTADIQNIVITIDEPIG